VITILHNQASYSSQNDGCFSRITNPFRVPLVPLPNAPIATQDPAVLSARYRSVCMQTHCTTSSGTDNTLALSPSASKLVLLENGPGPFRFQDSGTTGIEGVTATIGGWDSDSSDSDSVTLPNCDDGAVVFRSLFSVSRPHLIDHGWHRRLTVNPDPLPLSVGPQDRSGFWILDSGISYLTSGIWHLASGIWNLASGISNRSNPGGA
jgi:hypothetical protein